MDQRIFQWKLPNNLSFHGLLPKGKIPQSNLIRTVNQQITTHQERNIWVVTKVYGDGYYDIQRSSSMVFEFNFQTGKLETQGTFTNDNPNKHLRVWNCLLTKLEIGDQCRIGYRDNNVTQKPQIMTLVRQASGQKTALDPVVPPTPTDIVYWLQSNAYSTQNAVGSRVLKALLTPNGSTTDWLLPTSTETGSIYEGYRALGLGRIQAPLRNWETGEIIEGSPVDVYVSAFPRTNESGDTGIAIGAWRVSDRVNLWIAQDYFSGDAWENAEGPYPSRFFADSQNGWITAIERAANVSPQLICSACSEGKSNITEISRAILPGLNLANISLHSFEETVEDVSTIHSYICCPAHPATSGGGQASVDFLKMDQETGEWVSHSSFDCAYIPEGGPSVVPDLITFGSITGSPIPWRGNEAVLFASGGIQDLFDSQRWTSWHHAIRSVKPGDATAGSLLKSKTVEATDSPEPFANASLKSQALAAPYDLEYEDGFGWKGGIELGDETNSDWAYFQEMVPILLPAAAPNLNRVTDFVSALAINSSGFRRWPEILENCGGGVSVDSAGTVWFTVLEPVQKLYGGDYTLFDTGTTQETWLWYYNNGCGAPTIFGYSATGIHPIGGAPSNPTPGSPVTLTTPDGCAPGTDRIQAWVFAVGTPGTRPLYKFRYTQKPCWIWITKLYGVTTAGTLLEADISQKISVTHNQLGGGAGSGLGGSGFVSMTGTEPEFPYYDNVWQQPMSFPEAGLVCLLRDFHADDLEGNPSPHLEIRLSTGDLEVVSTVRLGSYDEVKSSDNLPDWRSGDQEWNPYAFGGPRMKGCLDPEGNPLILVVVCESKKVDVDTESQFKRICYVLIDLTDPSNPDVTRVALTSPDEGVGSSGDVPTDWPLWGEWDSLILTPQHVAWIKDSKFQEAIVPPP